MTFNANTILKDVRINLLAGNQFSEAMPDAPLIQDGAVGRFPNCSTGGILPVHITSSSKIVRLLADFGDSTDWALWMKVRDALDQLVTIKLLDKSSYGSGNQIYVGDNTHWVWSSMKGEYVYATTQGATAPMFISLTISGF